MALVFTEIVHICYSYRMKQAIMSRGKNWSKFFRYYFYATLVQTYTESMIALIMLMNARNFYLAIAWKLAADSCTALISKYQNFECAVQWQTYKKLYSTVSNLKRTNFCCTWFILRKVLYGGCRCFESSFIPEAMLYN